MELSKVTAVITGGASGLGRATATRFVAAGGRVALLDRPASAGADVAKTLGPAAAFTPADVTSADEVTAALERARDHLGAINVLVNCAGIGTAMKTLGKRGPASLEDFTRVIQVNLIGPFNCTRLAGVRVMTIAPGIFETPLLGTLPEPVRRSLAQQIPFPPRLGRPEEYAALVAHIVENEMLNGETIRLD